MARDVLPQRRPSEVVETDWQGHALTVTVGIYPHDHPRAGQAGEVFADTVKGGQMAAALADACVLLSLALQNGVPAADLAKSLGYEPAWLNGVQGMAPASPVGAVVAAVLEVAA